jgi:hypothetical protein
LFETRLVSGHAICVFSRQKEIHLIFKTKIERERKIVGRPEYGGFQFRMVGDGSRQKTFLGVRADDAQRFMGSSLTERLYHVESVGIAFVEPKCCLHEFLALGRSQNLPW